MPIRKPLDAQVLYSQRKLFPAVHAQSDSFINDRAVALGSAKGIYQIVGRIQDVIEQSHAPKVRFARQMKPEKIILQCFRYQLDKLDLTFCGEPNVLFFEL